MKTYASSDHAGFNLRRTLVHVLRDRGFDVDDRGPASADPVAKLESIDAEPNPP